MFLQKTVNRTIKVMIFMQIAFSWLFLLSEVYLSGGRTGQRGSWWGFHRRFSRAHPGCRAVCEHLEPAVGGGGTFLKCWLRTLWCCLVTPYIMLIPSPHRKHLWSWRSSLHHVVSEHLLCKWKTKKYLHTNLILGGKYRAGIAFPPFHPPSKDSRRHVVAMDIFGFCRNM